MSNRDFFVTDAVHAPIFEIIALFKLHKLGFENTRHLQAVIASMMSDAAAWDRQCQFIIKKYGDAFLSSLITLASTQLEDNVDIVRAYVLLFILEFDLSAAEPLPDFLREFKDKAVTDLSGRNDRPGSIAKFGLDQLPIAIMKNVLSSEEVGSFKNVDVAASKITTQIKAWDDQLTEYVNKVVQLKAALDEQRHAYNFVGLYKGFADMEGAVNNELRGQKNKLFLFGILILSPALLDIFLMASGKINVALMPMPSVITWGLVSLTCTAVFLYFFRIVLREVDSKSAQLMQLRLRMTLCQFVQSYASFALEVKKDNPETLSKFESLIFSGIVGTQDKLPSTFDGFEQLGNLIKSARGGNLA